MFPLIEYIPAIAGGLGVAVGGVYGIQRIFEMPGVRAQRLAIKRDEEKANVRHEAEMAGLQAQTHVKQVEAEMFVQMVDKVASAGDRSAVLALTGGAPATPPPIVEGTIEAAMTQQRVNRTNRQTDGSQGW